MKRKNKADAHHNPRSEQPVGSDVKVSGSVQVFQAQDAIHQHEAERVDDKSYKDATKDHERSVLLVSRLTLLITSLYFAATCFIYYEARRSADAAKKAAEVAESTLKVSQGAYVNIGKKDGVIADLRGHPKPANEGHLKTGQR
jgi:hypothetical protein